MSEERFVIIGASLAGAKAAETLRAEGYSGSVVMIGAEHHLPYDRPPLSKGALKGSDSYDSATLFPEQWYADHDIELRLGRPAWRLDLSAHNVYVHNQDKLQYDRLLLATGSSVRTLNVPGADVEGVHYLRTMEDSQRLRKRLVDRPDVVVVGAGWIGLEVAAAAREYGASVTVLEPQATPLYAALGPEVGQVYADLHVSHGVDLRLGESVQQILAGDGHVSGVVTGLGETLPAGLVVAGVGVVPNTDLAEGAGLEVDNGVLCDQSLRTSDPDVFAAGDIANSFNPLLGGRVRVEHWANALNGGVAAAQAMLGQEVVYDRIPYFYSDQYDTGMEFAGHLPRGVETTVVLRGDVAGHEFMAFWLDDDRVLAGMHINVWDSIEEVKDLIRSSDRVDPERLADPAVPLPEAVRR
ncbi:MAG TPA: FAD-dependent oxidoreductase [Nocardioidaceae bacterium]|nr:FAD-dependent oxidoreductase [Nocardioidaceae bacterium]